MIYCSGDKKLVEREFKRMGFDQDTGWRISDINKDFELCNTYPRFLIVPASFKDEDLESVAKFRYFRRIPTAVWRHIKNGCFIVRSSQPTVGWFGWFRNELDESLVQSYVSITMPPDSERSNQITPADETSQQDECDGKLIIKDEDDTDTHVVLGTITPTTVTTNHSSETSSKPIAETTMMVVEEGVQEENCDGATRQDSGDKAASAAAASAPLKQLETATQQQQTQLQQNNHNNNHQDATKVILSNTGKTIKLDPNPSESQVLAETTTTTTTATTTTTECTSTSSTSASTTSPGVLNGNDSAHPVNDIISPSVIETNTTNNTAPTTPTSKMLIIDARSYTAAMANRAKGGGCECSEYYQRCEVQFMNLANIHSIRKSFHAIRSVCEAYSEQSNNWVSFLDNSRWLHHISGLLKSALLVVDMIDLEEKSILIHCSDGWDRTPQLVALAEIMLDPHYRTFDGFRTLIQREWLDFGHKFADRCGSNPCNEDPNERCPVFLQWLDCVQQLLMQYPKHFEFNSFYLDKLNRHTYSNVFGTFSYNSTQERILSRVNDKLLSLWSYFDSSRRKFRNETYVESDEILRPSYKVRDLHFWKEVYLPPLRNQTPYMPIANNIDNKKFYDSLYVDGLTRTVCK